MNKVYEKLMICVESIRKRIDFQPEVALILGSGLGDYADEIQIEQTINYTEIEGFPTSTVAGHKGRFVFGYVNEVPVVIMQGRVHFYEGYPMSDVAVSYTHLDVYKRQHISLARSCRWQTDAVYSEKENISER